MNARALLAALLLAPAAALAQAPARGFAGLGSDAGGFAQVTPGRDFAFPADHAAHPAYRIEWWYITANLETEAGRPLGLQWTLFRQAVSPPREGAAAEEWSTPQLWMAHAAVTTRERHLTAETFARGGVGQAGVELAPFRAWIDSWSFESLGDDFSPLRLTAQGEGFAYDLRLEATGPFVLQGENGYSVKSERGQASYYYSQPFFDASGEVEIGGKILSVTGRAWLDREWSSQPLDPDQSGWDWFALHLPGGAKLMLYRVRSKDGAAFPFGTWIAPDGATRSLSGDEVEMRPLATAEVAGREIPVEWEVAVPSEELRLGARPLNPEAWMSTAFPYWEGPIRFDGTHAGVGYLEMTGY